MACLIWGPLVAVAIGAPVDPVSVAVEVGKVVAGVKVPFLP
jgi:hypothetical protein